jgi:hypothetical protein
VCYAWPKLAGPFSRGAGLRFSRAGTQNHGTNSTPPAAARPTGGAQGERRWIRASNALRWSCGLVANKLFRSWTFPRRRPNFRGAPATRADTFPRPLLPPGRARGSPPPGPARGHRPPGPAPGFPPSRHGRTVPPPGHEQAGRPPGPARGPRRPGPAPSVPPPGRELAVPGPVSFWSARAGRQKSRTSRRHADPGKMPGRRDPASTPTNRVARPPMLDALVPHLPDRNGPGAPRPSRRVT